MQLDDRGQCWIYHWLFMMVAGLRNFPKLRKPMGDGFGLYTILEKNAELYDGRHPDYIWIPCIEGKEQDFHLQTLDMISGTYPIIRTEEISDDDIVVYNWGEVLNYSQMGFNGIDCGAYQFLRRLMGQPEIDSIETNGRTIFIRRDRAHVLAGNDGLRRRQIINEVELVSALEPMGIECIYLEDLSMSEKIRMFGQVSRVISPNSAGLSFCAFMKDGTNVIEINVSDPSQVSNQYYEICRCIGINHQRVTATKIDGNDNMFVQPEDLFRLLS
jgi:hypothetical protein